MDVARVLWFPTSTGTGNELGNEKIQVAKIEVEGWLTWISSGVVRCGVRLCD